MGGLPPDGGTGAGPTQRLVFALGANLGDALGALRHAARGLAAVLDAPRVSGVYVTPPEGGRDQPDYLNAVVAGDASLTPSQALGVARRLEEERGRVRTEVGGSRTLDVDVLFVGGQVVDEPGLRVPHPRWRERDFVVVPLLDVAPTLVDPETGVTVAEVAGERGWTHERFHRVMEPGRLLSTEVV